VKWPKAAEIGENIMHNSALTVELPELTANLAHQTCKSRQTPSVFQNANTVSAIATQLICAFDHSVRVASSHSASSVASPPFPSMFIFSIAPSRVSSCAILFE
jgi:hypothetical protein